MQKKPKRHRGHVTKAKTCIRTARNS